MAIAGGAGLVGGLVLGEMFEHHEQREEEQAYDQGYDQGQSGFSQISYCTMRTNLIARDPPGFDNGADTGFGGGDW
jgi:hypothetical protein